MSGVKPVYPLGPQGGSPSSSINGSASFNLSVSTSIPQSPQPKKIVCPHMVDFPSGMPFSICYVQTDPLPGEILMLQKLNTKGLTFVRIPIEEKVVRLYLRDQICRLLTLCGINADHVSRLIRNYNKDATEPNRDRLLRIVKVALDFCLDNNIEFLTDRVEATTLPDMS